MFKRTLIITLLAISTAALAAEPKVDTAKLIGVLKSPEAPLKAKSDACRELAITGDPKAIPVLADLLSDAKLSHMARYALEPMEDESAGAALRDAMGNLKGQLQVGVINSIGARRDKKAVDALIKLLKGADQDAASAAIGALGKIATPKAIDALAGCRKAPPAKLQWAVADASLTAAEQLVAQGKTTEATAIYAELNAPAWPRQVRLGAFSGLLNADSAKAPDRIAEAINGKDAILRAVAIAKIATLKGDGISSQFASALPKLPAVAQVMLIDALAERNDPVARPAIVKAADHSAAAVRTAAIKALGRLGDEACAKLLCKRMVDGKTDPEKQAAKSSLRAINAKGVNAMLIKRMDAADSGLKIELINILIDRKAALATETLLAQASGKDPKVAAAAFKGLMRIGSPKEMPAILTLLTKLQDDTAKRNAQLAAIAVSRKITEPTKRADSVLDALKNAESTPAKCSLLAVLGGIGNAKAFDAVNAARKSNDPDICNAAVRALTVWPDATAVDTLLDIFASTKNPTHKALAFRGAVRLLSIPELDKGKALDGYKKLLAKAKQPGEIKLVLSGLSTIADPAALPMIRPYLSQKPVQKEATAALRKVSKALTVRPDDIIYTKFIKGVYGFEDQVVDVTSKIAARKNSAGTIDVTGKYNGLFGDPADREFKVLLITYELNGKQQTVKFIENTPFTMKLAGPKKADPPKKLSGEFKPLFDGKTLTGWKGRKSLWSVQDGAIVGQTSAAAALKHNDFLYTEKEYENFELTLSYKLVNHNSGVQIRSQVRDDFIITGYQADIAEKRYTGILYDEGRRGIIAKVKPEVVSKFIKPKEWNDYRIVCQGKEIKFWINGQPTISYTEKKASIPSKGVIAFQLHKGPPMKVLFKNIQIKELP